ncbi:hypothetical protein KAS79_02780 [Candidatus Parcubacteria bacterium]|nr:hypothetical protein [Candidatus Parcubacteria bacterium]
MAVITIPKKITQGEELIVVSRQDWEELLKLAKNKVSQIETEKGLQQALKEIEEGEIIGPFNKSRDLIKSLEK